jgi:molybdopterin-guanine dinucleotide biosynthesis protein A
MTKRSDILGALLAGGRSARMGLDKALLPLNGVPLVQYSAMALTEVFDEVVVVADEGKKFEFLHLPVIPDLIKNCGPLGGIYSALCHANGRAVFVLSCDTPFVTPELIAHIVEFGAPTLTRIPLVNERLQPLCGLYGQDVLQTIEHDIKRGAYKVLETLKGIQYTPIPITPRLPFFTPNLLRNLNTPAEYELISGNV